MTNTNPNMTWETMRQEEPQKLGKILAQYANTHLEWILAQAKLVAYNTRRGGKKHSIIGEFAASVAEKAAKQSRRLGISAFALSAGCHTSDAEKAHAIKRHMELLEDIASTDNDRALDILL